MLGSVQVMQGKVLVVTDGSDVAGCKAAAAFLHLVRRGATVHRAPQDVASAPPGLGTVAVFCSEVPRFMQPDISLIATCLAKLRPGGVLYARMAISDKAATRLVTDSVAAGAVEAKVARLGKLSNGSMDVLFSCCNPMWATPQSSLATVRIDEDELLGEVPRPVGKGKSDCSSAPKACANCSCGRKELEDKFGAEDAKKKLEQGTQRSACGSCYLGDAFRCDGCPYRGQPAFKAGTKVQLDAAETDGTGQFAMRVEAEESLMAVEGKAIKVS